MTKQCKESVHAENFGFYQCVRRAGFGPNGDYCRQHSHKHEKTVAEITIWKGPSKYDIGKLPEAMKVRENGDKSFIDAAGQRCKKVTDWDHYFDIEEEALRYCLVRAEQNLARAEREVKRETTQVALFEAALRKVKGER